MDCFAEGFFLFTVRKPKKCLVTSAYLIYPALDFLTIVQSWDLYLSLLSFHLFCSTQLFNSQISCTICGVCPFAIMKTTGLVIVH